jgi:hypothetical protein
VLERRNVVLGNGATEKLLEAGWLKRSRESISRYAA